MHPTSAFTLHSHITLSVCLCPLKEKISYSSVCSWGWGASWYLHRPFDHFSPFDYGDHAEYSSVSLIDLLKTLIYQYAIFSGFWDKEYDVLLDVSQHSLNFVSILDLIPSSIMYLFCILFWLFVALCSLIKLEIGIWYKEILAEKWN